jgi:hypothetical protein
VLKEIVEEDNFERFDQENDVNQDQVLESIQMDEGSSSFYIFYEQEDLELVQDNVVSRRIQVNKFKTKEQTKKRKDKIQFFRDNKTTTSCKPNKDTIANEL